MMRGFYTIISFLIILFISHISYAYKPPTAAIVIDSETGKVIFSENADAKRHPASLTKKMTLYMLFEALKTGKITLQTRFKVSDYATKQMPSKLGLSEGETITVESIIKALITKSANDMAVVAAEGLGGSVSQFVKKMNAKAKELGMKNTNFCNPSGVPNPNQVTTARDMVILAQALYNDFPEFWPIFKTKNFHFLGHTYRSHNHMLDSYPGLDGIKTGFINASGFNISTSAIRYTKEGKPIRLFAVVMGGESWRKRDARTAALLTQGFEKLQAIHVKAPLTKAPTQIPKDHLHTILVESSSSNNPLNDYIEETASNDNDNESGLSPEPKHNMPILEVKASQLPENWTVPVAKVEKSVKSHNKKVTLKPSKKNLKVTKKSLPRKRKKHVQKRI